MTWLLKEVGDRKILRVLISPPTFIGGSEIAISPFSTSAVD